MPLSACIRRLARACWNPFIKPSGRMNWAAGVHMVSQQPSTAFQNDHAKSLSRQEAREYIVSVSLEFQGAPLIIFRVA